MIVPNADVPGGEQIKILDFGIAKISEGESGTSEANTRADALLGTPKYMSPEQCKGSGGVDAKSDVYSLGVIFFELLAARPPFLGSAHGELIVQHIMQEPPPLATLAEPGTSEVLLQLVHRMLTKDKTLRPTMRQVVGELDRLGGLMSGVYGVLPQVSSGSGPALVYTPTPPPGGLSNPSLTPANPSLPSYPGQPGAGATPHSLTPLPTPPPGGQPSTLGLSAGQLPATPPRKLPQSALIGGGVGAVAVAVILFVSLHKTPPPVVVVPPPRPVVVPPPPAPPPAKKLVHWAVVTDPEGATVIRQRDGQVLGTTPLQLDNPAGSGTEALRIVLQGYAEQPLTMDLGQDSEQQFDLRRKGGRRTSGANSRKNSKGYVRSDLTVVD